MPHSPKPVQNLFALTITTSLEAAEAVAELLLRESGQPAVTTHDRIRSVTRVVAYLDQENYLTPERRKALRQGLMGIRECGLDIGPARIGWSRIAPKDWRESWKRHFKALAVGKSLLIRPSWIQKKAHPGQQVLVLDPGLSFGTGQHPTTGFCLKEIVRLRPKTQNAALLDVGTGSGILALAAAKVGYTPVQGFDFDPEAVRVARENAETNGLSHRVTLARGDVAKLSLKPRRAFHVVCANLTSDLLRLHARRLMAQVRPGGSLILAGILSEEYEGVRGVFGEFGATETRHERRREWTSGSFLHP